MEAIGNLTGGVAHDFNNLLTVVLGNLELVQEQVLPDDTIGKRIAAAVAAAQRGAELTHRLLAFSRQQPLQPTRIAVTAQLAAAVPLLRRTLGGAVVIEADLAADTWPVDVDASQLDNAVLNLALNARDAMPDGGRLTIASRNVAVEAPAAAEAEIPPGDYVRIAICDTGTGMPEPVRERAFDPFFTTKAVGKGTGLGLSMVYGFVKQSGGHASIESAVGRGTEVILLLPRAGNATAQPGEALVDALPGSDSETILVVEDDGDLRSLAVTMLRGFGYAVLAAASGAEGLAVLAARPEVALLFSDVILADGINGAELGRRARQLRPGLRILYTTGYTQDAFAPSEIEQEGFLLLHKPYRRRQLGEMVRQALTAGG
jgi:CheY-like chemotaxis protein